MNVMITRAAEQISDTVNIFSSYGLLSFCLPMISFQKTEPQFKYKYYDYCLLTSPTAAALFPADKIKVGKFIAIGEKTAQIIRSSFGANDVIKPEIAYIDNVLEILKNMNLTGKRFLAPGAETRIKDLSEFFNNAGADYEKVTLYKTLPVKHAVNEIENFFRQYKINAVTFFSPSAVNAFFSSTRLPRGIKAVSIGKTTTDALTEHETDSICPEKQTAESMAEMLITLSGV